MVLRMRNFNIMGGSLKCSIFRGVTKNQYIGEEFPKMGRVGGLAETSGVFLRAVDAPMHTMFMFRDTFIPLLL